MREETRRNLETVREYIDRETENSQFSRGPVRLIAVTKGVATEDIKQVIRLGVRDIGENRIQEALPKFLAIEKETFVPRPRWHMVGHLQTNKIKDAVEMFDMIQSVDSLRLLEAIDRKCALLFRTIDVLIQVNVSDEPTKFGLKIHQMQAFLREALLFPCVHIRGLMTVAPLVSKPEDNRFFFRRMRELRNGLNAEFFPAAEPGLRELSMGMSQDYRVAIQEGATIVRIGQAIFGR